MRGEDCRGKLRAKGSFPLLSVGSYSVHFVGGGQDGQGLSDEEGVASLGQ